MAFGWIEGIQIKGGYLKDQDIRLSDGLNIFMGPSGAGKTNGLQIIASACAERAVPEVMNGILAPVMATIQVVLRDGRRLKIVRDGLKAPIVTDEEGNISRALESGWLEIFSVSEITEIAEKPERQLDLVDRCIPESGAWKRRITQLQADLAENRKSITQLLNGLEKDRPKLKKLPEIGERLTHLHKAAPSALLKEQQRRNNVMNQTQVVRDELERMLQAVTSQAKKQPGIDPIWLEEDTADTALLRQMSETLGERFEKLKGIWREEFREIRATLAEWDGAIQSLSLNHAQQEESCRAAMTELANPDLNEAVKEQRTLLEEQTKLQQLQRAVAQREQQLTELQSYRTTLAEELKSVCLTLFRARQQRATQLTGLGDVQIQVEVQEKGDTALLRDWLSKSGKGLKMEWDLTKILLNVNAVLLYNYLQAADWQELKRVIGVSDDKLQAWLTHLQTGEYLMELQEIVCPDLPSLALRDQNTWKRIQTLSNGQKCTTILQLILDDWPGILVIDQIEDNMDESTIGSTLIRQLLTIRQARQVILASHNPNIPISGKADRVIVLESDSTHGWVKSSGTLANPLITRAVLDIGDGGATAFLLREQTYGEHLTNQDSPKAQEGQP